LAATGLAVGLGLAARRPAQAALPAAGRAGELALRDADITFFQARLARDPRSAADMAQLAGLYLQRARESGDYGDWGRAEAMARRSLDTRDWRNARAQLVLASSLLGQHRFAEARRAAETLVSLEPDRDSYRALLGEILLELGDYQAAERTFAGLERAATNLAVAPRLARWEELRGRPERARAILRRAVDEARRRPDLPREQVAWFHLRIGDLALRHGRLAEAEAALRSGLAAEPGDGRLMSAMARLAAARGRWREVIRWAERADAGGADLATLALLGDAYAAVGERDRALHTWDRVEAAHRANPEPFARQWTQYRLDHQVRLAETRAVLEREVLERPDVLGWDMLAWARYLTGDLAGAREAARRALMLGTPDGALRYHARLLASR
jgi:tetratricopeptide (TPR) repeat protein